MLSILLFVLSCRAPCKFSLTLSALLLNHTGSYLLSFTTIVFCNHSYSSVLLPLQTSVPNTQQWIQEHRYTMNSQSADWIKVNASSSHCSFQTRFFQTMCSFWQWSIQQGLCSSKPFTTFYHTYWKHIISFTPCIWPPICLFLLPQNIALLGINFWQ